MQDRQQRGSTCAMCTSPQNDQSQSLTIADSCHLLPTTLCHTVLRQQPQPAPKILCCDAAGMHCSCASPVEHRTACNTLYRMHTSAALPAQPSSATHALACAKAYIITAAPSQAQLLQQASTSSRVEPDYPSALYAGHTAAHNMEVGLGHACGSSGALRSRGAAATACSKLLTWLPPAGQ
jgi:hypothetical protein